MSMHKRRLLPHEETALVSHGLAVGQPSQLSDAFLMGMEAEREWLLSLAGREAALLECEGMGPEANGVKAFIARATQPNTNSGTAPVA